MNDIIPEQNGRETLQIELDNLRRDQTCDDVASAVKYMFKYGGMAVIMYFGYLILSFAGDHTIADMMLRYITTLPTGQIVAYSAGLIGVLFGVQQWRVLKTYESQSQNRIAELESRISMNQAATEPEEVSHV